MRYLISRDGKPADNGVYWEIVGEADESLLLENNHYLPLGFMVNEEVAYYIHDGSNPFISQNDLFRRATGLDGDMFEIIDILNVGHKDIKVHRQALGNYSYILEDDQEKGTFKWNFEIPSDGMFYVYCKIDSVKSMRVSVKGNTLRTINIAQPYIFTAGRFDKGELVSFMADVKAKKGKAVIYVGYLNQELFEEGYALMADETFVLTKFSETEIVGNVTAFKDGLLYTSIPCEKRWKVFVDGLETEIQFVDSCMAAIPLNEGTHKIEFHYYNNSFIIGIIISIISLISFAALTMLDILIHKKYSTNNLQT